MGCGWNEEVHPDGVYCRGYILLIERSPCLLYGPSEDKSFNGLEAMNCLRHSTWNSPFFRLCLP